MNFVSNFGHLDLMICLSRNFVFFIINLRKIFGHKMF